MRILIVLFILVCLGTARATEITTVVRHTNQIGDTVVVDYVYKDNHRRVAVFIYDSDYQDPEVAFFEKDEITILLSELGKAKNAAYLGQDYNRHVGELIISSREKHIGISYHVGGNWYKTYMICEDSDYSELYNGLAHAQGMIP